MHIGDVQELEEIIFEEAKDLMSNVDIQQRLLERINNIPLIRAQHRKYLNEPRDVALNSDTDTILDWDIDLNLSLVTDSDEDIDLTLPPE